MKFMVIALMIVVALAEASVSERAAWIKFKGDFGRSYQNVAEESKRFSIFQDNLKKIVEHNEKFENGESTFKMGVNQFADLTPEEFRTRLGYQRTNKPIFNKNRQMFTAPVDADIPDSIDWSTKGAVTEVKDQGSCGSCWSFSTTGTMEGQYFLKTGNLVSFSEQNLVDCDLTCYGCTGGLMDEALKWIEENGIMTEQDYPYVGVNEKCMFNPAKSVTKIQNYIYVTAYNENELKKAVGTVGPVSVAIDASGYFQLYASGILDDKACRNSSAFLNHGVLAVGYGSQNGKDYWIVKNSWGTSWGQEGYIWMSRNADNQCGIADEPVYPVL